MAELSVYKFSNYRKFLESVYLARKQVNPTLTLGTFSRRLGFGTNNYFGLILDRKRNLTVESIFKVASGLDLTLGETEYFEALVFHDQSESEASRVYYERRLKNLGKSKPKRSVRYPGSQILTEWYFPAILLLADKMPITSASEMIQRKLSLDRKLIEKALIALTNMKLIREVSDHYEMATTHHIFHDTRSAGAKHKRFLKNQLALSSRALEERYERGEKFYSHTFTIREQDFSHYANRLRGLLEEITALSDEAPGQQVVQLNIQLFRIGRE